MATVITGDAIFALRRLQIAHALALEVNTGLRFSRGSVMLLAARECGSTKRTKCAVLIDYVLWLMVEHGQELLAVDSLRRALGTDVYDKLAARVAQAKKARA